MIDLETYLEYNRDSDLYASHEDDIKEYNRNLVNNYPWLMVKVYNPLNKSYEDDTEFTSTWLDSMPDGWRCAFAKEMCDELQKELERVDVVNEYSITDIKVKFGVLSWSSGPIPSNSELYEIVEKYEELSKNYCMVCGKPTEWALDDPYWIYYYCSDCKAKGEKQGLKFKRMIL